MGRLQKYVRETVEESLNALLSAEANYLCGAKRYERSAQRRDYGAGSYQRKPQTRGRRVNAGGPQGPFETEIIECYRRKESSVEEDLMEMCFAGVSVRRIEDITEALWGTRVSPSTVSELNQKIYERVETWRNRPLQEAYPYVFLDGIWLKRSWGGETRNVSVLVAMAVNQDGYREVIGTVEGVKEDKASWLSFLRHLKERGLQGVQLIVSDKCIGLVDAPGEVYPQVSWQRCMVHFYRNLFSKTPQRKLADVAAMLKAIHAQEDKAAAQGKAQQVVAKLKEMKLPKATGILEEGIEETLSYYAFPREHQKHLWTNNPLERLMKEIRRRTRVVGSFPDGNSALMLACARLRYVTASKWGEKRYMNMDKLKVYKLGA